MDEIAVTDPSSNARTVSPLREGLSRRIKWLVGLAISSAAAGMISLPTLVFNPLPGDGSLKLLVVAMGAVGTLLIGLLVLTAVAAVLAPMTVSLVSGDPDRRRHSMRLFAMVLGHHPDSSR